LDLNFGAPEELIEFRKGNWKYPPENLRFKNILPCFTHPKIIHYENNNWIDHDLHGKRMQSAVICR